MARDATSAGKEIHLEFHRRPCALAFMSRALRPSPGLRRAGVPSISFPLQMAILTQPAFPVPIWKVLQVRNRILQREPLMKDAFLDIVAGITGHRILDKGGGVRSACSGCGKTFSCEQPRPPGRAAER